MPDPKAKTIVGISMITLLLAGHFIFYIAIGGLVQGLAQGVGAAVWLGFVGLVSSAVYTFFTKAKEKVFSATFAIITILILANLISKLAIIYFIPLLGTIFTP